VVIRVAHSHLGLPPVVITIVAVGRTTTAAAVLDFGPLVLPEVVIARVSFEHDVRRRLGSTHGTRGLGCYLATGVFC